MEGNKTADFDAESVGSGGSVLIGLENDDDFRNYKGVGENDDFSFAFGRRNQDSFNPIFGQSNIGGLEGGETTEEPVTLPPLVGRRNPLMMQPVDD